MEDTERQFVENQIVESFNEQKEELMTILSLDHLPDYVIQKDKILEIQFPARGITGTVVFNTETKQVESIKYYTLDPVIHTIKL